ncbi:hypothetical protein QWY86_15475 [Pedobacter aquatilis]|uniref:hypothetical protein n=1 Tax=Pedobacter aquatilis TaxID=351343 RepID=UPI0025B3D6D7|nr:hypothetical protein [Pedobacter aquatilis]MDN3588083.1 hypothetical protein [Pedobacter aquatilis]
MKKLIFTIVFALPLILQAQTNNFPTSGNATIYDYSPSLFLQRNTNAGGFTQGIQTKLVDGTNNWFFGNLNTSNFLISKGNHEHAFFSVSSNGNIGIGTVDPDNVQSWQKVLDVYGNVNSKFLVRSSSVKTGVFSHETWGSTTIGRIGTESNHDLGLMVGYGNIVMQLKTNGNVGIGTDTPREKLSVNGKIRAHEIKVEMANWPDYVFEEDYENQSLEGLEGLIKTNKHLPDVPSAKDAQSNGVDLGELNKLLLKKIEELTLHIIEINKELKVQKLELNQLKNRN